MKHLQILLYLLLCSGVFVFGDSQEAEEKPKRCSVAYKCSSVVDPVWATADDVNCEVLRNSCHLSNENCHRVNNDKPEAKVIEKEKCQQMCQTAPACSEADPEVCGYSEDGKQTFPSECEMKKFVCKTGEIFDLFSYGSCPKD